jgi:L-aminopeptidase/D-esterase-like protein
MAAASTADVGPMPHAAPGHRPIDLGNDELFDPICAAVVQVGEEAVLVGLLARHGRLRAAS